ncbi:MAG: ABC transporter ATP-binding protein, partial [Clostridia bacterium]
MNKQKIRKGTIKRLLGYIKRNYKKEFTIVFICIVINSIASVASSLFLQTLIDDYITPLLGIENPIFTGLLKMLGIMAIIYLLGTITGYLYNRLMAVVAQGVLRDIRNEMFAKMEQLPIKYFDTHTHGEIMSYYTNDTDTLRQMLSQSLPQLISSAFSIIAIFCGMIYLNPVLAILVLAFTILIILITKKIGNKSSKHFVNQQESLGKVNGYIEEMLNGQKVIKVFTHEEKAKEEFKKLNNKLNGDMYKANKYSNIMMPISNSLGNLQYVLIAIIGTICALNGSLVLSLGTIISFLQLTKNFAQPINQIMNQMSFIIVALAGAGRIFEMMDEEAEVDEGYVTLVNVKKENGKLIETNKNTGIWAWKHPHHDGRIEYVELKGYIELENVDFGYEEGKIVLHDICVYAKPGQKIAFVGATGAGKTTITNLINRFYDIEDGKIRYDGININKIKKSALRKSLGMVLQDTNLFTGTIKENIKYGNEEATDEEVINAAKLANANNFIERLPQGYDTMLTGNGANLSQGQRQLLSIARVAINNPPVMILDEATSSIDTRTEKIIQEGMDKLM